MRCSTLHHVTESTRKTLSTRWEEETELAPVRAFAAAETEGNVSQMIRKLVREALAARQAQPRLPEGRQQ